MSRTAKEKCHRVKLSVAEAKQRHRTESDRSSSGSRLLETQRAAGTIWTQSI